MTLKKFLRDESGMETVEWAILAALIVAGVIPFVSGIGSNVALMFGKVKTATAQ